MRQRPSAPFGPSDAAPAGVSIQPSRRLPSDRASGGAPSAARWRSAAPLAGLLLLVACAASVPPPMTTTPGLCRLGPDDGPPLADRGIGGTGSPIVVADRGIGGTGAPTRVADRGIGGTGIVAVITGFASICLGGVEVALDPAVPVTLDGQPIAASALRAGQLAIVDAGGSGGALTARSVEVRQEVSGPVEAVGTDGRLRVAGQQVQLTATTLGENHPVVGQWLSVSGLRGPDGVVQASRLDGRAPGEVLVRGQATMRDGRPFIGGLELRPAGPAVADGFVTATGRYRGGALDDAQLRPDPLASDPAAAFPATTRRLLVESYAVAEPGGVRLGAGPVLPGVAGLGAAVPRRAVVEFQRQPGGGFRAIGLRQEGLGPISGPPLSVGGGRGGGPRESGTSGRLSQPAPVPSGGPNRGGGRGVGGPGQGGASVPTARGDRPTPSGNGPANPLLQPGGGAPAVPPPPGVALPPR